MAMTMRALLLILCLMRGCVSVSAQPTLPERYGPFQQTKSLLVIKEFRVTLTQAQGNGFLLTSTNLVEWVNRGHILAPAIIVVEVLTNQHCFVKWRLDSKSPYQNPSGVRTLPITTNVIRVDAYHLGPWPE